MEMGVFKAVCFAKFKNGELGFKDKPFRNKPEETGSDDLKILLNDGPHLINIRIA